MTICPYLMSIFSVSNDQFFLSNEQWMTNQQDEGGSVRTNQDSDYANR